MEVAMPPTSAARGPQELKPMDIHNLENLWTADEVAAYFKCSKSFVYKQAEAGILPCLRIGAMLRFDPKAVRAFAVGGR
jgi:excisionase family DNA binding protein